MLSILLFFGLCFFGLGDCQENNTVDESNVTNSNQFSNVTIDWSMPPMNETAMNEYEYYYCVSYGGNQLTDEECKEQYQRKQDIINYYDQTIDDCHEFQKLESESWNSNDGYISVNRCVNFSDVEMLQFKVDELEQRVIELESTQQSLDNVGGKQ